MSVFFSKPRISLHWFVPMLTAKQHSHKRSRKCFGWRQIDLKESSKKTFFGGRNALSNTIYNYHIGCWCNVNMFPDCFQIIFILAISCPYSRAEHIPCQSSWGISGNCEDPFQVKFVFHTVCQVLLFFWHVRCRLHMFFPKEDPYFQQFLEMS